MFITKRNGQLEELDLNKIHAVLTWACNGKNDDALTPIKGVSVSQIELAAQPHFYDKMPTREIHESLIKAASSLISEDYPNYDQVAARLVWFSVRKEAFRNNIPPHLRKVIEDNVERGVYTRDILDKYNEEELNELNKMIDHSRDDLFKYAGSEQMRKKYLVQNRKSKQIYESFQFPYILVSALLFADYPKNERMKYVKRYYDLTSQHFISLPTPIMAGLRTKVKQFSSCFPAGQKVRTLNGDINIENIKEGDLVLTHNNRYMPVTGKANKEFFGRMVNVNTALSLKGDFISTADHLIRTIKKEEAVCIRSTDKPCLNFREKNRDCFKKKDYQKFDCERIDENHYLNTITNKIDWVRADRIETGDWINIPYNSKIEDRDYIYISDILPNTAHKYTLNSDNHWEKRNANEKRSGRYNKLVHRIPNEIAFDKEFFKLIGFFIAEGSTNNDKNLVFTFSHLETDYLQEVSYLLKKSFGVNAIIRQEHSGNKRWATVVVHSPILALFFDKLTNKYFDKKVIPEIMLNASFDKQKELLKGIILGDGCVTKQGITLTMWNKNLMKQILDVSLRCKLYPTMLHHYGNIKRFNKDIEYTLDFPMVPNIGFIRELNKKEVAIPKQNVYRNGAWVGNEYFSKVLNVKYEEEVHTQVYDIEVAEDHSFVVNNMAVHNCVLVNAGDSLDSIIDTSGVIVKYASRKAGLGVNIGRIRAGGQEVRNGDAVTTGVIPFAKYLNAALKSCSQGAVRGASATFNYPVWHLEFENLIELKNNKGTEETRIRTVDYCIHLHEVFYKRLAKRENITFFSPEEVPDLYDLFYSNDKKAFEKLYKQYEKDPSKTKKTLPATEVFSKILNERYETGRIYILNADTVNSHTPYYEAIEQTNLCTEIVTPTTPVDGEEGLVGLCTLSAVNWGKLGLIDSEDGHSNRTDNRLKEVCEMAVRGLDALLSYQEYPIEQSKRHTLLYRNLGVGIIGFAHWLAKHRLMWGAQDTLVQVEKMMERMAYYLIDTSVELAKEFGPCEARTKYHDGIMPIDTSTLKCKTSMDWNSLKEKAKRHGIRNATLMALMPSETSSQLANETNGIEPPRDIITIKGSKEGVLPQLVPEYAKIGPFYETSWQVDVRDYLKTIAVLQKYIDQAISVNTSYDPGKKEVTMSKLIDDLLFAYQLGHKTLYYNNTRDGSGEELEDDGCESGACKI